MLTIVQHPCSSPVEGNLYDYKAKICPFINRLATFPNIKAMAHFIKYCGIHLTINEIVDTSTPEERNAGIVKRYIIHETFREMPLFWSLDEIPQNAKPIKLVSNGDIVDGFVHHVGDVINIYRPNPNAKEVFKPLDMDGRRKHYKEYGIF